MHDEPSFEAAIEADLLERGWQKGSPGHYRPALGLDTAELMALLGATQAKAFDKLTGYYGGIEKAQRKVAERIAAEIDIRSTRRAAPRGEGPRGAAAPGLFRPGTRHHPGAAAALLRQSA